MTRRRRWSSLLPSDERTTIYLSANRLRTYYYDYPPPTREHHDWGDASAVLCHDIHTYGGGRTPMIILAEGFLNDRDN